MAIVASYNITNISGQPGVIAIEQVVLAQNETAGIVYRSPAVEDAISAGLISIVNTLSPEEQVTNLTEYVNSLESLPPIVTALPAGAEYVPPAPEPVE